MKKLFVGIGLLVTALVAGILLNSHVGIVRAVQSEEKPGQEVCPSTGNWVKVDKLSGHQYTYTVPSGKKVVKWCWKAGTTVEKGTVGTPSTTTVTVNSTVKAELSHASFLQEDVKEEEEQTLPYITSEAKCGEIKVTFHNPTKFPHWFDYRVDGEAGEKDQYSDLVIKEGPLKGQTFGKVFNLTKVDAGSSRTITEPFNEDSGLHKVRYGLRRGPEQKWFIDWKGIKTNSNCDIPQDEPEDPEEPTDEPKEEVKTTSYSAPSPASAPQCSDTAPVKEPANPHVYRNGDQAIVKWFPTEGNHAHIYYKLGTSDGWQHSVRDIDNSGYFVINGLGTDDWDFAVQQAQGCAAGPISPVIIDGNGEWVLFTPTQGLYVR